MSEIQPNTRNNLADINTAFAVTPGMSEFEKRLYKQASVDDNLLSDHAADINNGLDQLLNARAQSQPTQAVTVNKPVINNQFYPQHRLAAIGPTNDTYRMLIWAALIIFGIIAFFWLFTPTVTHDMQIIELRSPREF